jgi:mannose-6-phosphate isomerase-like protein (cupin superfamily)
MSDIESFIASGILEAYVMGAASPDEVAMVEEMAGKSEIVRSEINDISIALEQMATANAVPPDPSLRPFIMATIEYMERLKKGEAPSFPPMLHKDSKPEDYAQWTNRDDLQLNEPLEDAHAHIIGYTPEVSTAIVWLKYGSPPETHTHEQEKFLILEGTCEITIDTEVHKMKAGDVLFIPLHLSHHVIVTSENPCKIILQRAAA